METGYHTTGQNGVFKVLIVPCGMETIISKLKMLRSLCINCTLWNGNAVNPLTPTESNPSINCTLWNGNFVRLNGQIVHYVVLIVPCGMETFKRKRRLYNRDDVLIVPCGMET